MNKRLSPTTNMFFYLLEEDPAFLEGIDVENFDWDRFLRLASYNRTLHFMASAALEDKQLSPSKEVRDLMVDCVKEADEYLVKLKKTLEFCKSTLEEADIPYLIVKTDKALRFATMDVDLLVRSEDLKKVKQLFVDRAGARLEPFTPKNQTDVWVEGLLMIDLHEDFFWYRQFYFDHDLIWNHTRMLEIEGVEVPVPSHSIDMLLSIAHLLYEREHLTLLEFRYTKLKAPEVDWEFVFEQAKKYKWDKNLDYFCHMFNELHRAIYKSSDVLIPLSSKRKVSVRSVIEMPYLFPFWQMLMVFWRNLWFRRHIKWYDVAYHIFANIRCRLTKGRRYPMFYHWYSFDNDKS